jgi:hypothetical protein
MATMTLSEMLAAKEELFARWSSAARAGSPDAKVLGAELTAMTKAIGAEKDRLEAEARAAGDHEAATRIITAGSDSILSRPPVHSRDPLDTED